MTLIKTTAICAQLFIVVLPNASSAQADLTYSAKRAVEQLDQASIELVAAYSAKDRVAALTKTIQAFELGSASIRQGLRQIAIKKAQIGAKLNQRRLETNRVLGVLHSITKAPDFQYLIHPEGALEASRAGMLIAEILPSLEKSIAPLKDNLKQLETLNQLQLETQAALSAGLLDLQQARAALAQSIAKRTDLPKRFIEDPAKTALLVAAVKNMEDFLTGIELIASPENVESLPDITHRKGSLSMPVIGRVLREFNEADAAGIERPGIVIAAAPGAIVISPTAATVRYRGKLLDYGLVSILEPQSGILFVIAGMETVFGDIGDVLPAGSPVGLLPGSERSGITTSPTTSNTASDWSETLYIEVRKDETPQDPLDWFQLVKEEPS